MPSGSQELGRFENERPPPRYWVRGLRPANPVEVLQGAIQIVLVFLFPTARHIADRPTSAVRHQVLCGLSAGSVLEPILVASEPPRPLSGLGLGQHRFDP